MGCLIQAGELESVTLLASLGKTVRTSCTNNHEPGEMTIKGDWGASQRTAELCTAQRMGTCPRWLLDLTNIPKHMSAHETRLQPGQR